MTKPVTIPNTFATATTAIPLSQLDSDFSTVATALNDANTYSNYAADTGVVNAYVVTLSGVSTTYSAGLRIQFKAGAANTGASTLNVNGGGTKNITFQDASALSSGTIAANAIVDVMYDGTQFLLMNDPAGATGGDVVGPASATDNAIVRFDGTTGKLVQNSVVTIADSTGDISGVGQLNATTLDATNIEVTNIKAKDGTAAGSIADSTGVVTLASSVLTTTDINGGTIDGASVGASSASTGAFTTLTTSSTVTLNGGTANGVLYLDGSKVATSGGALTFDGSLLSNTVSDAGTALKLSGATGKVRVRPYADSTYGVIFDSTNAAESAYLPLSLFASNIYSAADTASIWRIGGSEQMRLTSTGLGIGTSSPATRLQIGDATVSASNKITLGKTTATTEANLPTVYAGSLISSGVSVDLVLEASSTSGGIAIRTAGSTRAVLDSSGNLGLGVTPSGNYSLQTQNNFTTGFLGFNLGSVRGGASGSGYPSIGYNIRPTNTSDVYNYDAADVASAIRFGSGIGFFLAGSGTAGNAISFTQALTLTANSNLLVGTTSENSGSNGLKVAGQFAVTASQAFIGNGSVNDSAYYIVCYSLSGTCTLTLPTPANNTGRLLNIVVQSAQQVVSASSNVTAITNGAVGTSILPATAGKWAQLWCDGTYWNIIATNV